MYSSDELFLRSLECYFCVYKHKNNPLVSAETIRHSGTYIILYVCHGSDRECVYSGSEHNQYDSSMHRASERCSGLPHPPGERW